MIDPTHITDSASFDLCTCEGSTVSVECPNPDHRSAAAIARAALEGAGMVVADDPQRGPLAPPATLDEALARVSALLTLGAVSSDNLFVAGWREACKVFAHQLGLGEPSDRAFVVVFEPDVLQEVVDRIRDGLGERAQQLWAAEQAQRSPR